MATQNGLNLSLSGQTGTGVFTGATSPTLVTPVLGVATATTVNKVALTAPATGSTLTIADGKTLTASNTLTFTGVDASSVNFGSGGTVTYGGGGGLAWTSIAGTTQTAAIDSGYIIGNAAQTTVTLPTTAAIGSTVAIMGSGAGGWILAPGAGGNIQVGSANATASVTSSNRYDSIRVVCIIANTTWAAEGAPQSSGLTIV